MKFARIARLVKGHGPGFLWLGCALVFEGSLAAGQGVGAPSPTPRFEAISPLAAAQKAPADGTSSAFADELVLKRRVRVGQPFTVAGPRGLLAGQQEGTFEAWILPVKLLSHFSLRAQVQDYPVPIELNPMAAEIQVYPDRTVITYTHIALTVRQTMFAPETAEAGTGAVVLFEIDSVRPVELTFSFTPEMRPMWPRPSQGDASPEWVPQPGAYVLHTDFPDLAGAVAMPETEPGVMAPYQEKPQTHPLELKLHYDPAKQAGKVYPLLMAVGESRATATNAALLAKLEKLNADLPRLYEQHVHQYAEWQSSLTSIKTPDASFDESFRWAELAIEQLRTTAQPEPHPASAIGPETSLVAGYFSSGDSARPGFGWFFGRDTLYTLYAVNGMGDFALSRDALTFLIRRQRADGKMMHEYSQTAASVDWRALPYMYAAADSTPLFLLAMQDYVRSSGDIAFLKENRQAVLQAWQFEHTHDSDGDGVYDNAQGTGWVESWPGGQPHQEIYLALLDQHASQAMGELAALLGDASLAQEAHARAERLRKTIEHEYYEPSTGRYAFSRNADGTLDKADTIYPSLAWWSDAQGLAHPQASLEAWDSHLFSTDWGARDVAENDPVYNPISYHQGSVWPLFTGWAALADYRAGRPLSGFAHLMQNADQTYTQDLGAVTELLSGALFTPFGRSTSHQLWSSSMVVTPALRGLFGLTLNAVAGTLTVDPHLPADWSSATIHNLHLGNSVCDLAFTRQGQQMRIALTARIGKTPRLIGPDVAQPGGDGELLLALPAVEVALPHGLPLPGARTAGLKVSSQTQTANSMMLVVEGIGGSSADFTVRLNKSGVKLQGDAVELGPVTDGMQSGTVHFDAGDGYQKRTVALRW
jgi:glycogen debranching enzyme